MATQTLISLEEYLNKIPDPDVVVDKIGEWPTVRVKPPMIVIEILSVGDSMAEMEEKCDAYEATGISNIWLIKPARRKGKIWKLGNWSEVTRVEAEGTDIYLDVDWLFRQIDGFKTAE